MKKTNINNGVSISGMIVLIIILMNAIIMNHAYINNANMYWGLIVTLPLLVLAVYDRWQKKHAVIRNYPVIGHLRYFMESIRPELRQYFFESDLDGKPFNRRQRSIVYQRAKNEKQTVAFGMQANPYEPGFEWVAHSLYPVKIKEADLRVKIGNHLCSQPYSASILNIGAMSYGALSRTAIESLNKGAMLGNFAHNTGEGGISEYHLQGGDLIWQIGTGYFGCRNEQGKFDPQLFSKNARQPQVKMIELKLSQGAKPSHGGILPGQKNTPEIAAIRQVKPGITVHSPAGHSSFHTPEGLVNFLNWLRELSGGKPVGFKICIGDKAEFVDICKAIRANRCYPDFITVDGAEGGTGAASLEFTDNLGMPLYDALAFVKQTLDEFNLSQHIKIIASGKIITGFDILKTLAMGASACYSSRGMMFSLGCIQALVCDSGKCPVGVATQNPSLYKGLHPAEKSVRVYNFHSNTIKATREMMEACGFRDVHSVQARKFFKKIDEQSTRSFDEIYFNNNMLPVKKQHIQSLLN